jgi:hypothetical protein
MTHPLVVAQTRANEEFAAAAIAAGATYATNPRAIAVAAAFIAKLRGEREVDDITLEELVTPATLPTWEAIFDDPNRREGIVEALRNHGVSVTRVRPQPDGRVGVLLPWLHPDNLDEDNFQVFSEPREVFSHMVFLEPVDDPGDWRVSGING